MDIEKELDKEKFEEFEEDFDAEGARYQVWLFTYDAEQNLIDSYFLKEFDDPDPAVAHAKDLLVKFNAAENPMDVIDDLELEIGSNSKYASLEVETVVDVENMETNVATLFQDEFSLEI